MNNVEYCKYQLRASLAEKLKKSLSDLYYPEEFSYKTIMKAYKENVITRSEYQLLREFY